MERRLVGLFGLLVSETLTRAAEEKTTLTGMKKQEILIRMEQAVFLTGSVVLVSLVYRPRKLATPTGMEAEEAATSIDFSV